MKRSVKRTMTVATVLLLAGTLAVPVFAWGPGKGRSGGQGKYGPGACWNENRPYGGSNLTEEQQGQLKALHQTHVEATMPIRNKLRAKRAEIRALMLAETLDEAKVRAVQKEINAIRPTLRTRGSIFRSSFERSTPTPRLQAVLPGEAERAVAEAGAVLRDMKAAAAAAAGDRAPAGTR